MAPKMQCEELVSCASTFGGAGVGEQEPQYLVQLRVPMQVPPSLAAWGAHPSSPSWQTPPGRSQGTEDGCTVPLPPHELQKHWLELGCGREARG